MRITKILFKISFLLTFLFFKNTFAQYQLLDAFPNLPAFNSPIDFQNPGDCTNRIFVAEQTGRIKVFENRADVSAVKTFLDITGKITTGSELGLLGLAFHPDYENNGYFYVDYTAPSPRRTVISRFSVSAENPDSADPNSEIILFTQEQPFSNHNGGQTSFGPDGYLYIAFGDGGSGGDPNNYAQNLTTLLGKIVRIDVDNPEGALNYGIPGDNPFKNNTAGYREEIYAYGLRNPWRFSFDPETDLLWCADVGQGDWEEIDIIENGNNYGWRCYEGNHTYNTSGCGDSSLYSFPVWEYPHGAECSVTGGFVYRGPNQPGLLGKYIYADYCSNKIWALNYDGINPPANQLIVTAPGSPSSFGVDQMNELYICSLEGRIYKFISNALVTAPSSLTAEVSSSFVIQLNWSDNSGNEDGFSIERKTGGEDYSEIATVNSDITTYEDNVSIETDYKYRIRSFNNGDSSAYSNEACVSGTLVPVELSLFTIDIKKEESSVILSWETASEKNNFGFEVERNLNNNWAAIGFVKGNGTTTEKSFYSFKDDYSNYGFTGTLLYRLKQIDLDGSSSYSGVVSVDLNILRKDYQLQQNYPNPFNPFTTIKFNIPEESKVTIEIINSLGEVVSELIDEVRESGFYNESWNASDFSSGVYYVRMKAQSLVSNKNYFHTIKMIYLK